jgi:hypothetical protein
MVELSQSEGAVVVSGRAASQLMHANVKDAGHRRFSDWSASYLS